MENHDVFDEIHAKLGSDSALASLCDVTPQAVYKWRRDRRIPAEHCKRIEGATGVLAVRIRPDIFGDAQPAAA